MSTGARWRAGAPDVRARVERWLEAPASGEVLRDNGRRALVRLRPQPPAGGAGEGDLLLKRFRASRRHPLRDAAKALAGARPVEREAACLRAAWEAGVPVPEPLGRARLADGDELLVVRFRAGVPLRDALRAPPPARRPLLRALGRAVAALHAAGLAHGDLHHGNVLVTPEGPLLLDLQRAGRASPRTRRADLARLDFSLWPWLSRSDRLRLVQAALGADARREIRAVARAAWRDARRHWRSRTRHAERPGRRFALLRTAEGRGLCLRDFGEEAAREALAAHGRACAGAGGGALLERKAATLVSAVRAGGRSVVVKEVTREGAGRALWDALRGSPARRAWRGGYGLEARGLRAAQPLAFAEARRLGAPVRSFVVLEDLRPARPATEVDADFAEPERVLAALGALALRLHRLGVDHGDLKASHVWLTRDTAPLPPSPRAFGRAGRTLRPDLDPALIDLDGVRFPRALGDARRLRALAQLNASLADRVGAPAERCAWFLRYASALPFARARWRGRTGRDAALDRIVAESLARGHHWKGVGCERAARIGDRPRPA